jgi:hypothetical protein
VLPKPTDYAVYTRNKSKDICTPAIICLIGMVGSVGNRIEKTIIEGDFAKDGQAKRIVQLDFETLQLVKDSR